MKEQKTYRLRLTALSPIHIGTGEDYEPTNFIIDDGYLYEFDEYKFYENLGQPQKERFNQIVASNKPDALFQIHALVKNNKQAAIKAATIKVKISNGIAKDYESKIGRAVQNEGKSGNTTRIFNQFQIAKTAREGNGSEVFIPGSSLKGSISTALQEALYKVDKDKLQEAFQNRNPTLNVMKNVLLSDAKSLKSSSAIGFSNNKERFEDDELGPTNKIEVISSTSSFEATLSFKDLQPYADISMQDIVTSCNTHYYENFVSMFREGDMTYEYFTEQFYNDYINFKPAKNQFLLRVGKHSGARAVTIDGMRKVKIHVSGGGKNRKPHVWETRDEETTAWLFGSTDGATQNLLPFGWLLCEPID
jgi:CRISPR-associated protein Csm5